MNKNVILTVRISLLVLICLTLAFIFSQSMLPKEESSKQSNAVSEKLEEIIPPDTKPGAVIHKNIRKIAHFIEFWVLGLEIATYSLLFVKSYKFSLLTLPLALVIALLDETVQIFSKRGPSVTDVWIDFSGFLFASVVIYGTAYLIAFVRKKIKAAGQTVE